MARPDFAAVDGHRFSRLTPLETRDPECRSDLTVATFRRKTALSLSVASLIASGALAAAQAVKLPSDILACRDVPSATERLDCYDSVVDHRQNIPATPAVSQEDLFGKSGDEIQRDVERGSGSRHKELYFLVAHRLAPGKNRTNKNAAR